MIEGETRESIDLRNRVTIEVHAASFKTVRGYSICAALLDELAFWSVEPADRRGAPGANLRRRDGDLQFTYVEATWTQALGDWIGAHTRALAAIGGVRIVPDNAEVAVIKACQYEPQSTEPMPGWRRIMAPPCCRPGHAGRPINSGSS